MARAKVNKFYRTFVRGLITEASYLTYPEDSSRDELNTVLSRKGNRARRLGMTYKDSTFVPGTIGGQNEFDAKAEFVWRAVDNNADINFLVVQRANKIWFFNTSVTPISNGKLALEINLDDYWRPNLDYYPYGSPVSFASGKGFLFIVHKQLEPIVVEYDSKTDTSKVTKIVILTRDFEGLNDGLANDQEPATLSKEHHYNLTNQGWVTNKKGSPVNPTPDTNLNGYLLRGIIDAYNLATYGNINYYQQDWNDSPINIFYKKLGKYPGNNKQWWVAKAEADDEDKKITAGDFLPTLLDTVYSGNNRAPRGHFILNAFRKDRSAASGVSDIPLDELNYRPNAVAFFSGRAWFAASSTVYFSQILDSQNHTKAGLCYQDADPTAEDISDLIASDGGTVQIPEADSIEQLTPIANGVMVFARNGVWVISGGDAGFSATTISTNKVSSVGTISPQSIVAVNDTIYWWSEVGIMAVAQESGQFGPIPGKFGNDNIAEQTIQTFYNNIPEEAKKFVKACYDNRNNVVLWLYRDEDIGGAFNYNRVLLLDLTLQAFYPWKFSRFDGVGFSSPIISGLFLSTGFAQDPMFTAVTDGGVNVTDSSVVVTNGEFQTDIRPTNVYYCTDVPLQGFTFSQVESPDFCDWKEFDGTGVGYESFIETGYEIHEDAMRDKEIVYLFAHMRRTEDELNNNVSSCILTTKWDWSNNRFSNKWSPPVEVYRAQRSPIYFDVLTSKHKVRGHGKSIQFRFGTNEIGRNFDILGWSVAYSGNTEP